jgi:hypothetical protein
MGGSAVTSGAVVSTIIEFPVQENTICGCIVDVVARDAVDGEAAYFRTAFTVKRAGAGASLVGAPVDLVINRDDGTWSILADANGNNARVQVGGVAGDNIQWFGILEVTQTQTI